MEFLLNNNFLAAVVAFGLVLIPVIIIHELGHYFAAKLVGISVLEFGIGFPPRVIKLFRIGETDFTLNLLPIGGFVRPLGEDMIGPQNTADAPPEDEPYGGEKRKNTPVDQDYLNEREELLQRGVAPDKIKTVNDVKPLPRIFFMVAGALANFATAIVLFAVIALIGLPQVVGARVQVAHLPAGSIFDGTPVVVGDAIELVDGELFSGMNDFIQRLQAAQGPVTLTMRSVETRENYTVTVTPSIQGVLGALFVTTIASGSPADEAGVVPGDIIIGVNRERLPGDSDPVRVLQEAGAAAAGRTILLTVVRGNETLEIELSPRVNPPPGEGRIGLAISAQFATSDGIRYVNSAPQEKLIPLPAGEAIQYGFQRTGEILQLIITLPGQLISGAISPEEARPVSVVGISQIGGNFLQESIRQGSPVLILNFVAMVSIFLGFTNLLPLPALDGGRVLFALVELVRGRPVAPALESRVHWFGFLILLLLGLIVIVYDIVNPFVLR
ncbi:MAG: RIP metalloprotease RseP [Anaerolineae bacterium]|jgi:regulator of sigma E protease|nr:RIP metalloprotease RseP [Anaerolineae bacterium]